MDSLTQMTLGAVVGGAILGRRYGRKSVVIGALCGTIPDLDVFIPMGDPVSDFTYHRGFSHSLIFALLMTPVLVWIFSKIKYFNLRIKDKAPYISIFLCLWTHMLLDAMTIYGTQLWWPLSSPPVGVGSIFIIDPLYTIPLLICLVIYLFTKKIKAIYLGLILSTFYLGWSMIAQNHVHAIAESQIEHQKILVQPTPFNTILWRVLVMNEGIYKVGYYSLFDKTPKIQFKTFQNNTSHLPDNWAVDRLKWFTKGFYGVSQDKNAIVMADLRMGLEPDNYVFQFIVSTTPNERYVRSRDMSRLSSLWDRMLRDF